MMHYELRMEIKSRWRIAIAAVIAFCLCGLSYAENETSPGRSGRVLAATLSGHGPSPESKSKRMNGRDIWWNYCIVSGDRCYAVLSREGPEKTGLKPDRRVRFTEDRQQVYILKKDRKPLALRILRKGKEKQCP